MVILVMLLALGCASFEVTTAEGTVVKSSAYGRGCVAVDTLPRTETGKVQKHRLSEPGGRPER